MNLVHLGFRTESWNRSSGGFKEDTVNNHLSIYALGPNSEKPGGFKKNMRHWYKRVLTFCSSNLLLVDALAQSLSATPELVVGLFFLEESQFQEQSPRRTPSAM